MMPAGDPDRTPERALFQVVGCLFAAIVGGIALVILLVGLAVGALL
jgi:hypothetical protein